jgi:hypothetical protein
MGVKRTNRYQIDFAEKGIENRFVHFLNDSLHRREQCAGLVGDEAEEFSSFLIFLLGFLHVAFREVHDFDHFHRMLPIRTAGQVCQFVVESAHNEFAEKGQVYLEVLAAVERLDEVAELFGVFNLQQQSSKLVIVFHSPVDEHDDLFQCRP